MSAYRTVSGGKKAFAEEVVLQADPEKFLRFVPLFQCMASLLDVEIPAASAIEGRRPRRKRAIRRMRRGGTG